MGVLDEAIREHLELKRRRGADPSTVAREEREALAPALSDDLEDVGRQDDGAPEDDVPRWTDGPSVGPVPAATRTQEEEEEELASSSSLGEETAELDMQAAMDDRGDEESAVLPVGPVAGDLAPTMGAGEGPASGPLDWDFPTSDEDLAAPREEESGQGRLSFE